MSDLKWRMVGFLGASLTFLPKRTAAAVDLTRPRLLSTHRWSSMRAVLGEPQHHRGSVREVAVAGGSQSI